MDNDTMMVSGGSILEEIYFSRCPLIIFTRMNNLNLKPKDLPMQSKDCSMDK